MFLLDSKMTSAIGMLSSFFWGCVAGFSVSWKIALFTLGLMLTDVAIIYFMIQVSLIYVNFKISTLFNTKLCCLPVRNFGDLIEFVDIS